MLKKLAVDNLVLIIQYAASGVVSLLLIPHIIREIGLASFGSVAIALSWASYGTVVVQYAFQYSGPHKLASPSAGERPQDVFSRIFGAKALLAIAVLPVMVGIALAGAGAASAQLLIARFVVLLLLPLAFVLHAGWYLQAIGRFTTLCLLSLGGALLTLLVGFGLVRSDFHGKLIAAAAAFAVGPLVVGGGSLLISLRSLSPPYPRNKRQAIWTEIKEGWPLFISQLTAAGFGASGPIIVGALAGTAEAGAYSAMEKVCNAIMSACMLTHVAAYPKLTQLYMTDRKAYLKLLGLVVGGYLAAVGLIGIALLGFSKQALTFLYGAQASNHGLLLATAIAWLVVGGYGAPLTGYLTVSGRANEVFPLTLKILATSLLVGIPAVLVFGSAGWMTALAVSQLLIVAKGWRAWKVAVKGQDFQVGTAPP